MGFPLKIGKRIRVVDKVGKVIRLDQGNPNYFRMRKQERFYQIFKIHLAYFRAGGILLYYLWCPVEFIYEADTFMREFPLESKA
jgi:hypothetical protein